MRASGEAEEVDTLGHVIDADLCVAAGIAASNLLSHAVEHLISKLGIAAVNKQSVVDGVRIDGKFSLVLTDGIEELDDDTIWHRRAFSIFGNHAIGVEAVFVDNVVALFI